MLYLLSLLEEKEKILYKGASVVDETTDIMHICPIWLNVNFLNSLTLRDITLFVNAVN